MSSQIFGDFKEDKFKIRRMPELKIFSKANLPNQSLILPTSTFRFYENEELIYSAICPVLIIKSKIYLIQEESSSTLKAQNFIDIRFSYLSYKNPMLRIELSKRSKFASIDVMSKEILQLAVQQIQPFTIQYGFQDKFCTLRTLGRGSFGEVLEVKEVESQALAAAKCIRKSSLVQNKSQKKKIAIEITLNQELDDIACIVNLQSIYEDENFIQETRPIEIIVAQQALLKNL